MQGQGNFPWRAAALMMSGGAEADQVQYDMLDTHIRMLDRAVNEVHRLSSSSSGAGANDSNNSADLIRWSNIRDENADHIVGVVASYFLSQRLLPYDMQTSMLSDGNKPGSSSNTASAATSNPASTSAPNPAANSTSSNASSTTSTAATSQPSASATDRQQAGMEGTAQIQQERQAYDDTLETAHKILVQTYLAKETSDPQHVQQLKTLATRLRQENGEANRQLQSRIKGKGIDLNQALANPNRQGASSGNSTIEKDSSNSASTSAGSTGAASPSSSTPGSSGSSTNPSSSSTTNPSSSGSSTSGSSDTGTR